MPTLSDLLSDPLSSLNVILKISYLSYLNVESVEWVSQRGWTDPANGPVAAYIPPLLETNLQISQHLDPLNPQEAFGVIAQLELINDLDDLTYRGRYDSWHRNSIDNRKILVYVVGILSTGQRVELADVLTTPLFALRGVNTPEPGDSRVILNVRDDSHSLDLSLQPVTYSPPCLVFPGTSTGCVDFGDNYDQTTSFSMSGWVYLEDPTVPFQYIFFKLSGFTGYSVDVGNAISLVVGAQTPPTTSTSSGLLHARFWHYLSFSVNTATGVREIGLDGVSVATTSSVTGTPNGSTVNLRYGLQLRGKLSRWTMWSTARTVAALWAEARAPVSVGVVGLTAYFPGDEGMGNVVHDRTYSHTTTGTAGTDVSWDIASWHLSSIAGAFRPFVLGTVPRAPVTWLDPAAQIGEVSYGGCALISEVQSNHNALGAIWSPTLATGTLQVTSGALSGTYSATVTANNLWNSAIQVSTSTSSIRGTVDSLSGSCTICIQFAPSQSQTSGEIIGWRTGAALAAGSFGLRYASGGANRLEGYCRNEAGTSFLCTTNYYLKEGTTYSLAIVRDTAALTLSVSVNGEVIATTTISGAFTSDITSFGIGIRGDGVAGTQAYGRYDEPLVFSRALTQDEIRSFHLLPAVGTETGLVYGWHFDDGATTTASTIFGLTSHPLTLTDVTWVGGRSCPADIARQVYYLAGFAASDLDPTTWRQCLNLCSADCGWFVGSGETALDISRLILGGLGFVPYKQNGKVCVRRFVGLTGIPEKTYSARVDVQSGEITADTSDPAVWSHQVLYGRNNTQMQAANIAGALASSDPDRYQYGQMLDRTASTQDYSIKINVDGSPGRFPNAIPKTWQTVLLNPRDARDEVVRKLALHRDGSDTKSVPMWMLGGNATFLQECAFDIPECEIDQSTWVVIGVELNDEQVTVIIWRPASQTYLFSTTRSTDDGMAARVTDEGGLRTVD